MKMIYRVFSKYCVFFQEFSKICHLSLASTRLLLVVQKRPANRSDCTLALRWELRRSLTAICRRERGCSELWKNPFFQEHPVSYICANKKMRASPTGTISALHSKRMLISWQLEGDVSEWVNRGQEKKVLLLVTEGRMLMPQIMDINR